MTARSKYRRALSWFGSSGRLMGHLRKALELALRAETNGNDELNPKSVALRSVFGFKLALVFGCNARLLTEIIHNLRTESDSPQTEAVRVHLDSVDLVISELIDVVTSDAEEQIGNRCKRRPVDAPVHREEVARLVIGIRVLGVNIDYCQTGELKRFRREIGKGQFLLEGVIIDRRIGQVPGIEMAHRNKQAWTELQM